MAYKIDSNVTGLRYAEEATLKTLPGSPVWYPLEPNSYSDFGGQLSTVVRNPINPSRQRKKGTITDLDASGGFNQDLTQSNLTRMMQGLLFADAREKGTTAGFNMTAIPCTAVSTAADTYAVDNDPSLGFLANHLVLASGFGVATNNGLKHLSAVSTTLLTTSSNLADEASPPAAAKLEVVGYRFASATASIVMSASIPRLTITGGFDPTTLGLIPGEWVYLGSDTAGSRFTNNTGWARVSSVTANYIEFDKTSWTPQNEAAGALTVEIYFGTVIKNESTSALVKRRTYHLERSLGSDGNGTMYEYLIGACPNELTLNIGQADKITVDVSFVALDNSQYTGTQSAASQHPGAAGTRPTLVDAECYNTSSDFSRIKLSLVQAGNPIPTPLFAYATELSLTVNNNVTPNKAIGTLGAFETTIGTFEVGGSLTAYFADITGVQAVRNNSDVTLDIAMAKENAGIVIDIPLLSLGDGRLNITQDEAITLPLEVNAAESTFGHTLLMNFFQYLPTVAEA